MQTLFQLLVAFTLASLTGCCSFCQSPCDIVPVDNEDGAPPPPLPNSPIIQVHSPEATAIIQDLSVELEYDKHLHLQQARSYYNDGNLTTIQLQFISQDILGICEARKLIVDVTEDFLARLNQNPVLGQEFASFPFRPSDLELYITFESYYGRYVDPYYVEWLCLEDDRVTFYFFDLPDNSKNCWHARHEVYSASREIVVYQREAERRHDEMRKPNIEVFGNQRYFPQ